MSEVRNLPPPCCVLEQDTSSSSLWIMALPQLLGIICHVAIMLFTMKFG